MTENAAVVLKARHCPRCRCEEVHRSHTRNPLERLGRAVGVRPFRCAECGWRGWRLAVGTWASRSSPTGSEDNAHPEGSVPSEAQVDRSRRHSPDRSSRWITRPIIALIAALALGATTGLAIHSCDQGSSAAADE